MVERRVAERRKKAKKTRSVSAGAKARELVVLTGMSGSGKLSALKAFEDLGYYSVDNLPLELLPRFADLVQKSAEITHAALVIDVREGSRLDRFPTILKQVRKELPTRVVYLEASEDAIVRRFSETRRPHPLGRGETVISQIRAERKRLDPVKNVADILIDTTKFTVHDLRAHINAQFERGGSGEKNLTISVTSFGFKNGVPTDADVVFDVRFLPNPHFVPEFRKLTGKHPKVATYVRQFPQTQEFLDKAADMLTFLAAALHQGREELPDGGDWMHGRAAPVGDDCRGVEETAERGGVQGEGGASRYAAVMRLSVVN